MTTIKRMKDRQYNDHNKKDEGQTIQPSSFLLWSLHCLSFVISLWSWYCLSFVLFIVVFALSVLCPFLLWSLYCLSFVIFIVVIAWSVLRPFYCGHCIVTMTTINRTKDRQCNDHNKKDEGQTIQ
jgi:Flp pilus assembly protein TadB